MSKEFYNYLAERAVEFFTSYPVRSGEKFILRLDSQKDVNDFYDSISNFLTNKGIADTFVRNDDEVYSTTSFAVGETDKSVKLAVIPEIDITNAYLTRIRNTVKDNEALFIICFNPIDSIAGGTENLQKEGMPFHRDKLALWITDKISESSLLETEKQVLVYDLENKKQNDDMDTYSLRDYANIFAVLHNGQLAESDFASFELFEDSELNTISLTVPGDSDKLKDRIANNNKLFKMINKSVRFSNYEDDLENMFVETYINKIGQNVKEYGIDGWHTGITFVETENAKKKKKQQERLSIVSTEVTADGAFLAENKDFFVRNSKETDAGRRKKSILIFNKYLCENIIISLGFSNYLGNKPDITPEKKSSVTALVSGKKVNIEISHNDITISRVKIKSSESFDINFCIINAAGSWFDCITSCYSIIGEDSAKKKKAVVINCNTEEMVFNRHGSECSSKHLEPDMTITVENATKLVLSIDDSSFEDNEAHANVSIDGISIPVMFKAEAPINSSITGIKIIQQKMHSKQSFRYLGNNKLTHGTNEYNTREDLRENLEVEEYIINNCCLSCTVSDENMNSEHVEFSSALRTAYENFIGYFKANDTLPSIAYFDDALISLATKYLETFVCELREIQNGKSLTKEQSDLFRLGVIIYPAYERIVYSSVHPLNVAYQLKLTSECSGAEIREDILRKLTSDNLVPFIHDVSGRLYKVTEQIHTPFWTYYCPADRIKNKGTGKFVADLVNEKINDFRDHFSYLFDRMGGNRLIINAINMGDCRNLFRGIINYYKSEIVKNPLKALAIDINIYGDERIFNVFEVLSRKFALKKTLEEMGIKEENKEFSESEFINLLMAKLNYYRKSMSSPQYDYCHLAFIEMDNKPEIGFANKNDIRSGTMLNGLLSGVTSMYYGANQTYNTGYGSQFNLPEAKDALLMSITEYYNSVMLVYGRNEPYNEQNAICTYINNEETAIINKTYDSSNWVVFIEPKVDLNFFKNDKRDIMIIHYSDQHTTSSGYDAITVTRKTEQYENILREYLESNGMPSGDREHIRSMIDMFNAINGDWMLKLISSKNNFSKEKISVQSAVKLALAFYKDTNIIWIPISLEEILRVSGSVGLAKDKGLFTAKNLGYEGGATSDDLLLFGVEVSDGKVLVHLYPLEVKIGYKTNDEIDKASKQIKRTKEILYDNLIDSEKNICLHTKVYRNFFAQLAVISAEKLSLYKVWTDQDWERIVNSDVRGKLLNDDFEITDSLHSKIGDGIIISFKENLYMRNVFMSEEITVLRFLYSDGINYVVKNVGDIYDYIANMETVTNFWADKDITRKSVAVTSSDSLLSSTDDFANVLDLPPIRPIASFNENDVPKIIKSAVFDSDNSTSSQTETVITENVVQGKPIALPAQADTVKNPGGMCVLFGNDVNSGKPLYWYPNDTEKIMHPNTGIIGTMGTGKTQFTKSLILQLIREQHNNPGDKSLGILIFDYKGDYNKNKTDFIEATNAKVYELYHLPFNPFSITVTENCKPLLPFHIANSFRDTLSKCYLLGAKQESVLRDCIMQAYDLKGINKGDIATWNRIPPTLDTVFKIYTESDGFKEDSLYSALSELQEYEIFESDAAKTVPLYDLIDGVTVINLNGYPASIQNLVVAITLDLFYSQMQVNGHSNIEGKLRQLTKFILVDEADNFLKEGFPSLRKILKEGREFGVGTILSTQFLKHFDTQDDDFAKYIFTWIVHNVADLSMKDVRNLFNTNNKSQEEEVFSAIKKLAKHHSFVKFGDSSSPCYIKDKAFWELLAEDGRE